MNIKTAIKYLACFYGVKEQTSQLDEEMAELTVETHKRIRGKTNSTENLISEIADVEIMLDQIKVLYKIEDSSINHIKEIKIKRQIRRIESANALLESEYKEFLK